MLYEEIEQSYSKTFTMYQHYLMRVALKCSVLMIFIELLFFSYYIQYNMMSYMSNLKYFELYVIKPTMINFLSFIIGEHLCNSKKIANKTKLMIPLINFIVIASNCAIVHCSFPILYGILAIPIYISNIYGDKKILNKITISSVIAETIIFISVYFDKYSVKPNMLGLNFILSYVAIFIAYYMSRVIILHEERKKMILKQNVDYNYKLTDELKIDGLTGLYNYKTLYSFIDRKIKNNNYEKIHISIIDIDNFKLVNDTYGHEVGNIVLKKIGELLNNIQNDNIKAARYGGEEFAVFFNNKNIEEAFKIIDEVRQEIIKTKFKDIPDNRITFSAGISEYKSDMTTRDFIDSADTLLYIAKANGKNKVIIK